MPININMNLKTTKRNIEELGLEVLDLCPKEKSEDFIDGYVEFVSSFIEDFKGFYGMVENLDGTCYVDFEYTCETTNRLIKIGLALRPLTNKEQYLAGSFQAQINMINAFLLEFTTKQNKAA